MATRSLRSIVSAAALAAACTSFACAASTASFVSAAGNNVGIEVVTPAPSTRYHGLQGNGGYVLSLFINSPRHDAPAGTYPRDAVPLDYKLTFAVCQNRISYARVIGRFDAGGAKQSTYLGTNADWRIVHDEEYVAGPRCPAGSQRPQGIPVCHYTFANTKNKTLDFSALPANLCATTLQLVAVQGADRSGGVNHSHPGPTHASFGVTPAMLLDPDSNWQKAHKMTHAVNLWLNFACASSSSAPSSAASSSPQSSSAPSSSVASSSGSAVSSSVPASSSAVSSSPSSSSAPSSVPQSSAPSSSSSSVPPGCIEIRTETFGPQGAPVTPVAQFTYALDGARTAFSDATGYARFDGVAMGTRVVQQQAAGTAWMLESVTPAGGAVLVQGGSVCAGIVFKNRQVLPSLAITKTDGRVTARAGEILTYTITVTNPSQAPAAHATVTDTLPAEIQFLSASDGPQVSGRQVTWTGLTLSPGTSRTFSIQAQVLAGVPAGTVVRNTARVTGPAQAEAEDITRIEGDDGACMDVSIDTDRDPVEPGEELTYTVTVRNTMNGRRETEVFLTLPDDTAFQDASDDGEEDDGAVEWTVELDPNEEIELEATVEVDSDDAEDGDTLEAVVVADCGIDEETTEVETDDGDDDEDENEDISVLKDASPSEVFPGGTVEYTVTVENNGDSTLEDIRVTDRLSGVHFSIIDDGGADSRTGNTLKWTIRELKKGRRKVLRYRIVVDGAAYPGDRVTNVVTAESGDAEDEADANVTVIGSLPQTGFAGGLGTRGGSSHLTPYAGRGGAGGGTSAAAAIAAALSGIGAGLGLMRRRLAGI